MKKLFRGEYASVWDWFLHLGPMVACAIINVIAAIVLAAALWMVHWFTRR